jgi:hypothetical protein
VAWKTVANRKSSDVRTSKGADNVKALETSFKADVKHSQRKTKEQVNKETKKKKRTRNDRS